MSTWTMNQVTQARGIRAKAQLDAALRERDGVRQALARQMFNTMNSIAQSFALELHPDDLQFRDQDETEFGAIDVIGWWQPASVTVELLGGERDGQVVDLQGAPDLPLMLPVSLPIDWSRHEWESVSLPAPERYECVGWSESRRTWIYSPD